MCQFLLNYLTNREYKVQVGDSLSNVYIAPAGIAQGSVISCLLYILYISDFPEHEEALQIKTTQFADDVLLSTHSRLSDRVQAGLNSYLNYVTNYLKTWKIKVNEDKCEATAIVGTMKQTTRSVRKKARNIEFHINEKPIRKNDNLKYLGVHISKNYKFNFHLRHIKSKMLAAYFSLKRIFFNKKINSNLKLLAYKQIIRPIALYAAPIWRSVSNAQMNQIAILERKILRACTGLFRKPNSFKYYKNELIYEASNTIPIEEELARHALNFLEKITNREIDNHTQPL